MAGIIANFQAPNTVEDLLWLYENYQGSNIDFLLQGAEEHYTEWTVAKNSKVGDTVFFFCATTSIDKIKKAHREANKTDNLALIQFAEKEIELYEKFSGQILAWGRIISEPRESEFGGIEVVDFLDTPIPYSMFKSFAKLNSFGAITYLNEEQLTKIEKLVGTFTEQQNALKTTVVKLDDTLKEGKRIEFYGTKYERNPKVRNEFLSKQSKPYKCVVCGFDYEKHYGQLGQDYIEVHHKTPLSVNGKEQEIDIKNDLVCLCSNCHRMIHRKKGVITTVDELKEIFNQNSCPKTPQSL